MVTVLSYIVAFGIFFFTCLPLVIAVPAAYGIYRKIRLAHGRVPLIGKIVCVAVAILLFILLLPLPHLAYRYIVGVFVPGGYF